MVVPRLPGVGNQSRLAATQLALGDQDFRQEALNRSSGQQLLSLLAGTGLAVGDQVSGVIQQGLDRTQRREESALERASRLSEISSKAGFNKSAASALAGTEATAAGLSRAGRLAEIAGTGTEARLTGAAAERGRATTAETARKAALEELLRQETRQEDVLAPRAAGIAEALAAAQLEQRVVPANIASNALESFGPLAAERFKFDPTRIKELGGLETELAVNQARALRDVSREEVILLEQAYKDIIEVIQNLESKNLDEEAQVIAERDIPALLRLHPDAAQASPFLKPIADAMIQDDIDRAAALDTADQLQGAEDAARRAARFRATQEQENQLPVFVPGGGGPRGSFGFGPGRPF